MAEKTKIDKKQNCSLFNITEKISLKDVFEKLSPNVIDELQKKGNEDIIENMLYKTRGTYIFCGADKKKFDKILSDFQTADSTEKAEDIFNTSGDFMTSHAIKNMKNLIFDNNSKYEKISIENKDLEVL